MTIERLLSLCPKVGIAPFRFRNEIARRSAESRVATFRRQRDR